MWITDVTSIALRNEEMAACLRLFRMNSLKEGEIWHIDLLLGNNSRISKYTTAVTE
jgi:hypothetical protein